MRPLTTVAKAVLVHIHDALSSLFSERSHKLRPVAQLLQSTRPVPIHNHVDLFYQLLEDCSPFRRLKIYIGGVLAHVSVDLEERDIAEVRARDFEDVCAILSQDSCDDGASDDAAHLQNFDAGQKTFAIGIRERARRSLGFELFDCPGKNLTKVFALSLASTSDSSMRIATYVWCL